MIWIDDLTWLEPDYLRQLFLPEANSLSLRDLAAALAGSRLSTQDYFLSHLDEHRARQLRVFLEKPERLSQDQIFAAQMKVMGIYFWEVVYRKHPDVYDLFAGLQVFPLDELFPLAQYQGRIVADVGCGTGRLPLHMAPAASHVYGIDPAEPMLEIARSKLRHARNVTFLRGTFARVPLADESVDVVVSNMAFHCTEERGGEAGLRSLKRIVRPNGEIRIVVANARCQDYLLESGFTERFVPGDLEWKTPAAPGSMLLDCLLDLSRNLGARSATGDNDPTPPHLFCPSRWRSHWTHAALIKMLEGFPVERLFHRGDYFFPIGVPAFTWRKPPKSDE